MLKKRNVSEEILAVRENLRIWHSCVRAT